MSQITNADINLLFSVHRVPWLCKTLTKHCKSMANANENLLKHLRLAVRQLKLISESDIYSIDDEAFELVDQISGLLLEADNPGITVKMQGPEIVAALKGIINTTTLNTLHAEDKAAIRSLLDIINLCLFTPTYQVNA